MSLVTSDSEILKLDIYELRYDKHKKFKYKTVYGVTFDFHD